MKASDLRIGNWIDSERGLVQVAELQLWNNRIGVKSPEFKNFVWSRCEGIKPILLTEEWHNKFGVKLNGFKQFVYTLPRNRNIDVKVVFDRDYVFIRQGSGGITDDIFSVWNNDITKRDMYVHEWQNLYHALTGEELELT